MELTNVDFRIIVVCAHQILLERIQDDAQWQVILSVFVDPILRYDEWANFDSPQQAREWIAAYQIEQAEEFFKRATAWWVNESARLVGLGQS